MAAAQNLPEGTLMKGLVSGPDSIQRRWNSQLSRLNRDQPGISGLISVTEAWKLARSFLWPRDMRSTPPRSNEEIVAVKEAFDVLGKNRLLNKILEAFVQDLRKQQYLIEGDVKDIMTAYENNGEVQLIKELFNRLVLWWKAWSPPQELGQILATIFNQEFLTHLHSILPPSFPTAFKRLCESTVGPEPDPALWTCFETLGLLDRYENLIASVCYEQIEVRVKESCARVWGERVLDGLRTWMAERIVPWMIQPYARGAKNPDEQRGMLQGIGSRFDFHVCKTLCDLRTSEIFDIIVDYPDSNPALLDLKECLQRVDQRGELVQTLRRLNRRRLLHPGADTKDILNQYVSMIRCLRIIDPPGVLLYKVADPVRKYLRERPDTIRSIVASLVGEGGDLVDENEPIVPLQMQVEDYSDPNWEPEAMDAGPDFRSKRPTDVVSTLVSIYDSKDLFVKELQVLLAQKLLAITDNSYEKERRNIEILKVRFGEAPLQVCEVMLRDMTDSRRIDQHVQSQKSLVMHPTVISKHFWPAMTTSKLRMPGQFKEIVEAYSKEFATFKPDKKLRWIPQLGTVDLEIELRDRTLEMQVSPLEAAIIELFSSRDEWTVDDLAKDLNVDPVAIHRGVTTWIEQGVIREVDSGKYVLLEDAGGSGAAPGRSATARHAVMEEEQAPPVASAQLEEAEQMRVYWKFIEGMLTNLGALPLDRIQTMLKFTVAYTRTIEQLGSLMEAARREGLVTLNDGLWKLNK